MEKYIRKKTAADKEIGNKKLSILLIVYYLIIGVLLTVLNTFIRPGFNNSTLEVIIIGIILPLALTVFPLILLIRGRVKPLLIVILSLLTVIFSAVTILCGIYTELYFLYFSALIAIFIVLFIRDRDERAGSEIITIIIISAVIVSVITVSVAVFYPTHDGIRYKKTDDGLIVVGAKNSKEIVIPEAVNGNAVTAIERYAFNRNYNAESLIIPSSVKSIGRGALVSMKKLNKLEFNPSAIEGSVNGKYLCTLFNGSADAIPLDNMTAIPDTLTSVKILGSVPSYCFYMVENLTEVTYGTTVRTIGEGAFGGCVGLSSMKLPDSLIEIGNYAFSYCTKLKTIESNAKLKSVGSYAFQNCKALTVFYFQYAVSSVGDFVFADANPYLLVRIAASAAEVSQNANWSQYWALKPTEFDEEGKPTNFAQQVYQSNIKFNQIEASEE